jgi:hypothetical protein
MARKKNPKPLPTTFQLLGHTWNLKYTDDATDETYGQTYGYTRTITLNAGKNDLPSTAWHELVHAVFHITGLTEILGEQQEEAVAMALESAYSDIKAYLELFEDAE